MEKGNLMLFFKANLHLLSSIPTCKTNLDSQFLMDKINYNPIIFLFLLSNVQQKKKGPKWVKNSNAHTESKTEKD